MADWLGHFFVKIISQDLQKALRVKSMCQEIDARLFIRNFQHFSEKYEKFDFLINVISRDLQKA